MKKSVVVESRDVEATGRYRTTWGNKTPEGIYHTIKRIIEENEVAK